MPTQRPATIRHRASLLDDATAIVESEYPQDLTLDDIARRVASSRRQLQRAYAEIGRTTFRDHLTGVRMERAAEMLTVRGLTVREVAHRVGYRQPAQFAKAFRRHHGEAPSAFRIAARRNGTRPIEVGPNGLRPAANGNGLTPASNGNRRVPAGNGHGRLDRDLLRAAVTRAA
jgi:AraC family transcriptional regulator, regulatory protein of adaptative response / methylphosphotriester-DNA alkyltransferase methyltransferase